MTTRWIPASLLVALVVACAAPGPPLHNPDSSRFSKPAPDFYRVKLETTKGPILIDVHREWAPNGADRFYHLVRAGYYDDTRFFRVVHGRWAQFGINGDPKVS